MAGLVCCLLAADPSAAGPLKVTMVEAGTADLPLAFAIKEGCLAKAGVAVELMPVTSGATAVLASGQVELSISPLGPVLAAWQNGADLKVLAFLYPPFDYYAISRYPETEASKIKTIAVRSTGVTSEGLLKPFIDHLKLDRKAIKTVLAKGDTVKYAMLEMGYADLVTATSYELARKVAAERKFYLIPDPYQGRTMDAHVITTTGRALRKKGPELEKFIYAVYCSINSLAADKAKTVGLLISKYGYTEDDASAYHARLIGALKTFDYIPSPERVEPSWLYVEDVKPEARKKNDTLLFPEYAIKTAAGLKP